MVVWLVKDKKVRSLSRTSSWLVYKISPVSWSWCNSLLFL